MFSFPCFSRARRFAALTKKREPTTSVGSCFRCLFLLSEFQFYKKRSVSFDVELFEIVQKTSSGTYHLQQTSARMVVVVMHFKVFGEVVYALRKQSHLHFGTSRVALVRRKFGDNFSLSLLVHVLTSVKYLFALKLSVSAWRAHNSEYQGT
jgi:hypothetical protein